PMVVHFHGPWAHEGFVERPNRVSYGLKRALEKAVYRKADRFIVLSQAFHDVLAQDYGVPEDRIRIVPGGADIDRFDIADSREEARRRLGWPTDRPILLAVRRLARRMGLENLIGALDQVRREVPDVLLLIAGKGPLAETLQAQIDEGGLEDHVKLLGYLPDDDLPLAYRAANLSVVPTVAFEGFGLITVESLAAGTPVLVTPVGGLPEVVRDLAPELVFDQSDEEAIADRLTGVLRGNVKLPDAASCRCYAAKRFDWRTIAAQTRDVYEEVLA
ncbi:MAG: glycosyltransferase family 4 protein, partial [Rhodothermales bacterium]